MTTTELQHDLDAALDDAELLARQQISGVFQYLSQGQRFSAHEIRALVDDILSEVCATGVPVVTLSTGPATRWMN